VGVLVISLLSGQTVSTHSIHRTPSTFTKLTFSQLDYLSQRVCEDDVRLGKAQFGKFA